MKHRIALCLILFTSCFVRGVSAQPPQQVEAHQQEKQFVREAVKTFSGKYLLYLPDNYSEQPSQKWPLLLYLHSSDARGQELKGVEQEGLPFILRSGTKLPFIVVAPLCPPDEWWDSRWSVENLNVLLDELLDKYRVDSSRIYLTGWSMGGAGAWRLASQYPSRFAAVVPICGKSQLKFVDSLRDTPVWAFHGDKDTVVAVRESQKMVDGLKKLGGEAQLTVFPDTGHEAWPQVYSDPLLYEWLLKHSTKETAKP